MTKKLYKHDCPRCKHLGVYENADLYYCPQMGIPTIIARFSDDGADYIAGLVFAEKNDHLKQAKIKALELGYLSDDDLLIY